MAPWSGPAGEPAITSAILRWFDEYAEDGILTTDTSLRVQSWNRWLTELTGVTASQILGRQLIDVFPSLAARGLDLYYAATLNGEVKVISHSLHQFIFPAEGPNPKPGRMMQSGRISPLYDGDRLVGTITVVEDVSERVANERELRTQIASAEAARFSAESASRVKDEFLATLSHEIRTPLNAVLGWTRILQSRDELDLALVKRAIEVIDRNATAQLTLITDMLDVARIAAGKVRLDTAPVDLVAVALAALDVVRPIADAKGVRLVSTLSPSLPRVMGDADRLQQVIWNLLSNSVKFTPPAGTVTVTLDVDGNNVRLVVTDTGQGIAPDFLPQIFQRFKQAEASSSRRFGGLGLGLALVNDLVELHGGKVSAQSAGVGAGATFTVLLPARPEKWGSQSRSSAVVELAGDSDDLAGLRVLIVEDDDDAREILVRTITGAQGVAVPATSTAEALALLRDIQHLPQVIVTDIGMPVDDGYAFLQRLRRQPVAWGGAIPAIALTAFATHHDKSKAFAAGFSAHLSKPFAPAMLIQTIATLGRSVT